MLLVVPLPTVEVPVPDRRRHGRFTTYLAILYFGISPDATYEILYLPTFLKGLGMMIIFIAFGIYVVEDLPPSLTIYNAFS